MSASPRAERFRRRQQAHFEALADAYADEAAAFDVHSESLFRRFLAVTAPPPGGHLLEIGAGGGRYTVPLLRAGYRVDAVDLSARALGRLAARAAADGVADRLRTILGDAETVGLADHYDLVYGIHLLHHVPDPVVMLRAMARAARPGGVVACLEPNPLNPAWYVYITLDRLRSWRVEYGMLRGFPWQVSRAFRRAGLARVTRHMYGAVPISLVNRSRRWLALEEAVHGAPGLRLACAVQIVRGVRGGGVTSRGRREGAAAAPGPRSTRAGVGRSDLP